MKLRIYNEDGSYETWYDIKSFSLEYQKENNKTFWLFLVFEEDSPNFRRFLPYGECAISYEPKKQVLDVKQ